MVKPVGHNPVPTTFGFPGKVGAVELVTMLADSFVAVAVGADAGAEAAAAGAAMAAAITGTLHAAVLTTVRRSKLAFGAARLWISDIFYPKFLCGGETPFQGKLLPSVSAAFAECTQESMILQYQASL